jgi:hypothetical protein
MRESLQPLEQSLGIGWYATETSGIGGYLRREPEDFVVDEEPTGPWGDAGPYLILRLTKRNWEEQRLVKELARAVERSGAKAGTAVILDPATGGILALANQPTFDPNHYKRASSARGATHATWGVYVSQRMAR